MRYDLAVIGAGWAGFNAALKAKELGLKVCLIEKAQIGGTCLNRGCIPTKALIQSAKVYSLAKKSSNFGIQNCDPAVDFLKIQERKDKIIQGLRSGMEFMLKGVDFINAEAQFISNEEIKAGPERIEASYTLIACGSKPAETKNLKFDHKKIISSDDILNLKEIPKSLLIIGGGVIGCEFASLFSALGSQVSVVELMPQLLPGIDNQVARKLELVYKKIGIKVSVNTDVTTMDLNNYDLVLLSIGRAPNLEGLNLDQLGIKTEKNKICTDEYLRTNISNIYAAGDSTAKLMLAHFAAYQGCVAAENIAHPQQRKRADNLNIPGCVFTDPEIAVVGLSQLDAANKGIEVKVNKFDFLASGMARIIEETEGFVKIISDKNTGQILGAAIIGPRATELISVLTLAISNQLKISQIKDTIFAHPTLSEAIADSLKESHGV